MKCPYLQGQYLQSCKVSREVYVPSQYEFDAYCTHSGYKICPSFTKSLYEGRSSSAVGSGQPVSSAR
jgi:hypothetical protein